jgi:SAM-dependent methyltransferase
MPLSALQKVWEDWAQSDPLWAILSDPAKSHRRWDRDEFFLTGKAEVDAVMHELDQRGIAVHRNRCLDFGCGVGRLTQALAEYFEICDGVDISPTMIREAQANNGHPDRCFFWLNDQDNLQIFPSDRFDFIYSNIVLQHIEPDVSERYVREFVRLLADGGIAMFQIPSRFIPPPEERLPDGAHLASLALAGKVPALVAGRHSLIRIEVRNGSVARWRSPRLSLGNHWRGADGRLLVLDDGRMALIDELQPGAAAVLELPVRAPERSGSYLLEFDMVEEGICWFADRGSASLQIPVVVAPASRRYRFFAPRGRQQPDSPARPAPFALHALHRDRVVAAVREEGGRVVAVESYNPVGEGWESYRYYVTTAESASTADS